MIGVILRSSSGTQPATCDCCPKGCHYRCIITKRCNKAWTKTTSLKWRLIRNMCSPPYTQKEQSSKHKHHSAGADGLGEECNWPTTAVAAGKQYISIASFKCPRMDLMQQLWSREWGKQNLWSAETRRKVSYVWGREQRGMLQTYGSNTTTCRMIRAFSYHRPQWILMDTLSISKCRIHMKVTTEKDQLRW